MLTPRHGPTILVRPLANGDAASVRDVFDQLSDESRRARFNGPKPCLSDGELEQLATVDASRHALLAYVEGEPRPVAIARLARQGRTREGIGSALAAELIADARAAGITEITALTSSDNPAALALLRRTTCVLDVTFDGPDLSVRAAIA
jgi:hypothetical protein